MCLEALKLLVRIEVGIAIVQSHDQPYGEHPPHVVDKPAAIVLVLKRVAQRVNHMPLLRTLLGKFPHFLHADGIDLRTFPGVELKTAYQLLGERAAHPLAENDCLGQNIDSRLERSERLALLADAAIPRANADQ